MFSILLPHPSIGGDLGILPSLVVVSNSPAGEAIGKTEISNEISQKTGRRTVLTPENIGEGL